MGQPNSNFSNKLGDIRKYLKKLSWSDSFISLTKLKYTPFCFLFWLIPRTQHLLQLLSLFLNSLLRHNNKRNIFLRLWTAMFVDRQNKKPAKFFYFVRPNAAEVWIKFGETTSFRIRNWDAKSEIRMKWRWALKLSLDCQRIQDDQQYCRRQHCPWSSWGMWQSQILGDVNIRRRLLVIHVLYIILTVGVCWISPGRLISSNSLLSVGRKIV